MSRTKRIILIIVIAVLIAGMALYPKIKGFFTSGIEEPAIVAARTGGGSQPLSVNAMILKPETLDQMFTATGRLFPDEEVDLAFETSGKITDIYFQEGTFVRKGDLLAKINDKPLQAELKKLEAQIPLAEDMVFRQQSLLEKDAVSQESYETVATELEKLRADIELVKARIAETELRAPFDGMIGLRQVSEGVYASPTVVISRLTKISPLKIEFSVNQGQVGEIRAGTPLTFTVANDPQKYSAAVYAVESRLDEKMMTLQARALYENPGGRIKPGHSVSIEIRLRQYANSIVIPGMSSIAEMGRDIVYVYSNGVARQRTVTKGIRTASSLQILEGLSPGDTLITSGMMQLRDGMPLTLHSIAGQ